MNTINKQEVFEILLNNKEEIQSNLIKSLVRLNEKIDKNKEFSEEIFLDFEKELNSTMYNIVATKTSASPADIKEHIETLIELGEIDELLKSIMSPEEAILVMANEENLYSDDSE